MRRSDRATARPPGSGRLRRGGVGRAPADAGYVTAEAAMVVPALVLLTGLLLWGLAAVGAQIMCVDAARAGARAAARSEAPGDVLRVARAAAPPGAAVRLSHPAGMVRVRVTAVHLYLPVTVTAQADALDEATLDADVPGAGPTLGPGAARAPLAAPADPAAPAPLAIPAPAGGRRRAAESLTEPHQEPEPGAEPEQEPVAGPGSTEPELAPVSVWSAQLSPHGKRAGPLLRRAPGAAWTGGGP